DIYQTAARSFAKALGRAVPTSSRMDLRAEVFSRILYLHMAALSDVLGLGLSVENLLQGTIEHERRFWFGPYTNELTTELDAAAFSEAAGRAVAAVTLRGGAPSRETAAAILQRAEGPKQESFVRVLRSLYPSPQRDRYLSPLEPDLLGESLVLSVLQHPET